MDQDVHVADVIGHNHRCNTMHTVRAFNAPVMRLASDSPTALHYRTKEGALHFNLGQSCKKGPDAPGS